MARPSRARGEGASWVVILVYLKTYEILRRSSGLLAANGALDDVGHRLGKVKFGDLDHEPSVPGESAASPSSTATVGAPASLGAQEGIPIPLTLAGYAGGASVAGLVAMPSVSLDTTAVARKVRDHICVSGFHVGGVDMALEVQVAASVSGVGESPLLALGRADHLMRAS